MKFCVESSFLKSRVEVREWFWGGEWGFEIDFGILFNSPIVLFDMSYFPLLFRCTLSLGTQPSDRNDLIYLRILLSWEELLFCFERHPSISSEVIINVNPYATRCTFEA